MRPQNVKATVGRIARLSTRSERFKPAQLVNIGTEAEECIKLDSKKKNHFYYERVAATKGENDMVIRMADFLVATEQGSKYELWKRSTELPRQREKKEHC